MKKAKLELTEQELCDIEDALEWSLEIYREDRENGVEYVPRWKQRTDRLLNKIKNYIVNNF